MPCCLNNQKLRAAVAESQSLKGIISVRIVIVELQSTLWNFLSLPELVHFSCINFRGLIDARFTRVSQLLQSKFTVIPRLTSQIVRNFYEVCFTSVKQVCGF